MLSTCLTKRLAKRRSDTVLFLFHDDFTLGNTVIVDAGIKKDELDLPVGAGSQQADARKVDAAVSSEDEEVEQWRNLDLIMEIPLELTVELGRTSKRIYDVLKLNQGAVVDLVQLEDEPVDLLVNDALIAKGEVVVEKEKYGIRIVEVVSRMERVNSFRV